MPSTPSLVCRAADDSGPLFSADTIGWSVAAGAMRLRSFPTELFGRSELSAVSGAHVYYAADAAGSATLQVALGDLTRDLPVTLE